MTQGFINPLPLPLSIANGGTASTTAASARAALSAAVLGANGDITSMTGLTGAIQAPTQINDASGNEVLKFASVASAVNEITITNAATGTQPLYSATGGDSNIAIDFQFKGTARYRFYGSSTIAASLKLYENTTTGTNAITLQCPDSVSADLSLTLPSADAAVSGNAMVSNAAGVLSFLTLPTLTKVAVQVFVSSGTYTPTSGMKYCIIETVGGGGGGGGVALSSGFNKGGGGGSGAYGMKVSTAATVGASQTVTIGAGGAGGVAGASTGSNGGTTSVGAICTAGGGYGGPGAAANTQTLGGAGGDPGTGDAVFVGGVGGNGSCGTITTIQIQSGAGGRSRWGSGTFETRYAINTGVAATNYGDGGSGAESQASSAAAAGGVGFKGCVIITEYISI